MSLSQRNRNRDTFDREPSVSVPPLKGVRMPLLQDKVCVITGGAGSLGLASARLFLREGAKIMLVDLGDGNLERAKRELNSASVDAVVADVSNAAATRVYIERTVERFGPIDVLFSNAGNQGPVTSVTEYPEDAFDAQIAVHVRGAFLACKYGLPRMNDGGSIIITSSVVGAMGAPGVVAYVTAKHAQVGLMRSVAKEAARRRIRVNTLHPGPIDNAFQAKIEENIGKMAGIDATKVLNDAIPLHRHASPEEIARSALYLASDLSSFVTGSMLMADGGMRG
jgi:NAD(P)-dependent dehydrogenase (short-subunit alcohol dehydrogenase family)